MTCAQAALLGLQPTRDEPGRWAAAVEALRGGLTASG